jgi:hypothetical protein
MSRPIFVVLAAVAAQGALSQPAATTTVGPSDSLELGEAYVDSTDRFLKPIMPTQGTRWFRHWHPRLAHTIRSAPASNLLAGSQTTATVATPGPKFPGISFSGFVPPDPSLGVGPSYMVQVVNTEIAFFNKTGTKTFQQTLDGTGFFSGVAQTDFVFDPRCVYDQGAKRFIVIALEQRDVPRNSAILLAVSDDSNPSGTWYKYRINTLLSRNGQQYWWDYPQLAYNKDALVVTGNMFSFTTSSAFGRSLTIKKPGLLVGGSTSLFGFNHDDYFTLQAARSFDQLSSNIYGISLDTTSRMRMFAWRNLTGTPALSETNLTVPAYSVFNSYSPAPGSTSIDAIGDRMMDASFRGGRLLAAHTVRFSSSDNRARVRWYEVAVNSWPTSGSPTLVQSGNVGLAAPNHCLMPAIAKNGKGAISIVLTRTSPSINPGLYRCSRRATDPLGSMGPLTLVAASQGNPNSPQSRWGDYFGVVIDPLDPATLWGTGQVLQSNRLWRTEIFSWAVN